MWGNVSWGFEANTTGGESNVSDTFRFYPRAEVGADVTTWDEAVVIAMFGAAGMLIFLGIRMNPQHIALMILFLFGGLYMIGMGLGAINEIALAESAPTVTTNLLTTAVKITTLTIYVSAAYFMIVFLYGVMMSMMVKNKRKKK